MLWIDEIFFYDHSRDMSTEGDVERWIEIVSDNLILEETTDDRFRDMTRVNAECGAVSQERDSDSEAREDKTNKHGEKMPLPPLSTILQNFQELENIASDNHVHGAICHLHQARQRFLAAKRASGNGTRQLLNSELFSPEMNGTQNAQ